MPDAKRELELELEETDRRTRLLLDDLSDSQLAVPYERGINPPIWELGHAAFFYEYFLLRELGGKAEPRMPGYDDDLGLLRDQRTSTAGRRASCPDKATMFDYYDARHRRVPQAPRTGASSTPVRALPLPATSSHHHQMHIESLIWARQTLGLPETRILLPRLHRGKPRRARRVCGDAVRSPVASTSDRHACRRTRGVSRRARFSFDNERPGFTRGGRAVSPSPRPWSPTGSSWNSSSGGGYAKGKPSGASAASAGWQTVQIRQTGDRTRLTGGKTGERGAWQSAAHFDRVGRPAALMHR